MNSVAKKPIETKDRAIHVIQGEYKISRDPRVYLSTILGSCVAVCLRDPKLGLGGMNHFLLPFGQDGEGDSKKYGAYAMELLINKLLRLGAERDRLEAKVFGGGRINVGMSDIGSKNVEFARSFLSTEKIPCVSESVGGTQARRVKFWPVSGRARQLLITSPAEVQEVEKVEQPAVPEVPDTGDVELF